MSTCTGWIAFAAVVAVVPSTMVAGREAQPAASAALCWQSLAPETGAQDMALAMTEPTLAATESGEIWLNWQENDARILRWAAGQWTSPPAPTRVGVDGLWVEVVAASPSGRVVVAAAANRDDGASELHIARMIDGAWEWLGAPLISSREPFTHAQRASTRLVRAYTCAAGETPAAPPKPAVERDTWPTTVDEAARRIVGALDNESKARVRTTKKDQLIQYHLGWGMGIRNSLGLWRGNEKLLESCGHGRRVHPDECSMVIIEAVWTLLQGPKPEAEAR